LPAIEAQRLARFCAHVAAKGALVIDLIRGLARRTGTADSALTKSGAARGCRKVLRSAIANAERKAEDAGRR